MTAADLELIKAELAQLPPPPRSLTKAEALRELAPELARMQASGHTAASIAAALSSRGLKVSVRAVARTLASAAPKNRRRAGAGKRLEGAATGEAVSSAPSQA